MFFPKLFDSDIESSLHESNFQSNPDEISSHMNDTDSICDSEVDIMDNIAEFDENWRFLCVADVEVDPVCRRLDKTNQKQKYLKRPDFLQISGQHDTNILRYNIHMTKKGLIFLLLLYTTAAKVRITLFVGRLVLVTDKVL